MQKKSVHKYCHVNAYVAYGEDSPIYKNHLNSSLNQVVIIMVYGKR